MKKVILSTSIGLLSLVSLDTTFSSLNIGKSAEAYQISGNEKSLTELKKYYTQEPLIFSNKWLFASQASAEKGQIYVKLSPYWSAHIHLVGDKSWGAVNKLQNSYVDVFGLKDRGTDQLLWNYTDYFTGGVSPAHKETDPAYKIHMEGRLGSSSDLVLEFYLNELNKPKITLKELDFRIRETLVKKYGLYDKYSNGQAIIKMKDGEKYTLDFSKRLDDSRANVLVDGPKIEKVEFQLKNT